MKKRRMTAEDLLRLKFIRSVCLSPDEARIMFTAQVASDDKKKYYSHIYMVNIDGTSLRQYTFGKVSDSNPVFSPDGRWIVFTSKRDDKKGLYKMSTAGGEAKLVVEKDGSFSDISVSPDSKKILCVFTKADDVPKDKDGKKEAPAYRHITRMFYKLDNEGFRPKDPGHIYTYDMETGECRQVTKGRNGERSPVWLGNGRSIAYIANVQREPDFNLLRDDIFVVSSTGGKSKKLKKPAGPVENIAASPDGKEIAFVGNDNPFDEWGVEPLHIWKVSTRGGKAVDLTPKLDRLTSDLMISDTAEVHGGMKPVWSSDGREIYFQVSENGSTRLYKIGSSGRGYTKVTGGKIHLISASLTGKNSIIASIISTSTDPAEIFVSGFKPGSGQKQVTQLNSEVIKKANVRKPEEMIVRGHDGYPIHAWIIKPPDFSARRKYPSIMEIHGGPRVQYGHTFFHEMQFLAACGYVVYYCNPRGGQGYGKDHAAVIINNWGTYDYEDCMSVARFMASRKYINKNRMGVTGGSYGGYMTNWIVSHTDFFKAAVTQRSVTNFISFYGSSDLGFDLDREIKGSPWKNLDSWWEMSPIKHVANIKTPLLIIHSENDLRCPIEQAEQLYISLKKLRRKVEMIRFPEEPHGLSRCGRPDRRIVRLEWIQKWFDRYLKGKK
ncbi:MAG: S9 family peptidase [Candidatus Zixiibacteriota bacterium]|nr:MAG: S9 family peptidase [candidate division Zixibacteria bacterium]